MNTMLPKSVPALAAKHMHKGSRDGPRGTHCLLGWCSEVGRPYTLAYHTLRLAVCEQARDFDLATFNDATDRKKSTLADAWNYAMSTLGYVRNGNRFVLSAKKASAAR